MVGVTVTVTVAVAGPPVPAAVQVYVVVCVGFTVRVPLEFTGPTPLMVTLVAFCAMQDNTTGLPGLGLTGGFAVKELMVTFCPGGGFPPPPLVTVTVAFAVTVPKELVAVRV